MDSSFLVSLGGQTAASSSESKPRKEVPVDGELFSKILDDKSHGKEKELVTGKEAQKGNSKELRDMDEQFRLRMGIKHEARVGSKDHLHELSLRDPSTLTNSERQMLKLGDAGKQNPPMKDLQSPAPQRGLKSNSTAQTAPQHSPDPTKEAHEPQQKGELEIQEPHDKKPASKDETLAGTANGKNLANTGAATGLQAGQFVDQAKKNEEAADARKMQREEVIKQIIAHIDVQNMAHRTEVMLKLNPEYLGDLKINISFEAGGKVSADFHTSSKETKALIDEGVETLKEAFSNKGMTLLGVRSTLVEHVD